MDNDVDALVKQYYDDAIRISNRFHTHLLTQADKESIALEALLRAARLHDPTELSKITGQPVKFSTLLYEYIWGSLITAKNRTQRQRVIPDSNLISEDDFRFRGSMNPDSYSGMFDFIPENGQIDDNLYHDELKRLLKKKLSRIEWIVLNLLTNPDHILRRYYKYGFQKCPSLIRVNLSLVAKILRVSRQRVHQHMLKIRRETEKLLQNLNKDDFDNVR